jgi:Holliday junction DNA helicase RuvA
VIALLQGKLVEKQPQRLIVDVQGVGYEVHVPLSTFYGLGEPGTAVTLRVHTHVREDALALFGFATRLEQDLFERLIAISGIGPRLALAVLSGIEPLELVRAVRQADVARMTRIPGVGKKTAERISLELKDRLPPIVPVDGATVEETEAGGLRGDLLSALANLGYQPAAAETTVDRVLRRDGAAPFQDALKTVLREMTR